MAGGLGGEDHDNEFDPIPLAEVQRQYYEHGEVLRFRTKQQAGRFFDGLELVDPGVVQMHKWHPDPASSGRIADKDIAMYAGVAGKP